MSYPLRFGHPGQEQPGLLDGSPRLGPPVASRASSLAAALTRPRVWPDITNRYW